MEDAINVGFRLPLDIEQKDRFFKKERPKGPYNKGRFVDLDWLVTKYEREQELPPGAPRRRRGQSTGRSPEAERLHTQLSSAIQIALAGNQGATHRPVKLSVFWGNPTQTLIFNMEPQTHEPQKQWENAADFIADMKAYATPESAQGCLESCLARPDSKFDAVDVLSALLAVDGWEEDQEPTRHALSRAVVEKCTQMMAPNPSDTHSAVGRLLKVNSVFSKGIRPIELLLFFHQTMPDARLLIESIGVGTVFSELMSRKSPYFTKAILKHYLNPEVFFDDAKSAILKKFEESELTAKQGDNFTALFLVYLSYRKEKNFNELDKLGIDPECMSDFIGLIRKFKLRGAWYDQADPEAVKSDFAELKEDFNAYTALFERVKKQGGAVDGESKKRKQQRDSKYNERHYVTHSRYIKVEPCSDGVARSFGEKQFLYDLFYSDIQGDFYLHFMELKRYFELIKAPAHPMMKEIDEVLDSIEGMRVQLESDLADPKSPQPAPLLEESAEPRVRRVAAIKARPKYIDRIPFVLFSVLPDLTPKDKEEIKKAFNDITGFEEALLWRLESVSPGKGLLDEDYKKLCCILEWDHRIDAGVASDRAHQFTGFLPDSHALGRGQEPLEALAEWCKAQAEKQLDGAVVQPHEQDAAMTDAPGCHSERPRVFTKIHNLGTDSHVLDATQDPTKSSRKRNNTLYSTADFKDRLVWGWCEHNGMIVLEGGYTHESAKAFIDAASQGSNAPFVFPPLSEETPEEPRAFVGVDASCPASGAPPFGNQDSRLKAFQGILEAKEMSDRIGYLGWDVLKSLKESNQSPSSTIDVAGWEAYFQSVSALRGSRKDAFKKGLQGITPPDDDVSKLLRNFRFQEQSYLHHLLTKSHDRDLKKEENDEVAYPRGTAENTVMQLMYAALHPGPYVNMNLPTHHAGWGFCLPFSCSFLSALLRHKTQCEAAGITEGVIAFYDTDINAGDSPAAVWNELKSSMTEEAWRAFKKTYCIDSIVVLSSHNRGVWPCTEASWLRRDGAPQQRFHARDRSESDDFQDRLETLKLAEEGLYILEVPMSEAQARNTHDGSGEGSTASDAMQGLQQEVECAAALDPTKRRTHLMNMIHKQGEDPFWAARQQAEAQPQPQPQPAAHKPPGSRGLKRASDETSGGSKSSKRQMTECAPNKTRIEIFRKALGLFAQELSTACPSLDLRGQSLEMHRFAYLLCHMDDAGLRTYMALLEHVGTQEGVEGLSSDETDYFNRWYALFHRVTQQPVTTEAAEGSHSSQKTWHDLTLDQVRLGWFHALGLWPKPDALMAGASSAEASASRTASTASDAMEGLQQTGECAAALDLTNSASPFWFEERQDQPQPQAAFFSKGDTRPSGCQRPGPKARDAAQALIEAAKEVRGACELLKMRYGPVRRADPKCGS